MAEAAVHQRRSWLDRFPVLRDGLGLERRSTGEFGSSAIPPPWSIAPPTASGAMVTPENAFRMVAVYAAIRLLSENTGALPVDLFRRQNDQRVPAEGDPNYQVLVNQPNPEMVAPHFWSAVSAWMLARGNTYIVPERSAGAVLKALWILPSNKVQPVRVPGSGALAYRVYFGKGDIDQVPIVETGKQVALLDTEILHVPYFGLGPIGMSPIDVAREAVGLGISQESYAARFFANDARPGGAITVPTTLSDESFQRLKMNWQALHGGARNAHMMALLENGAQWTTLGITNEAAQFLESRKYQIIEIARLFNVPPHLIQDVERSTSWGTGIESQATGFLKFSLLPLLIRIEASVVSMLARTDPTLKMRFNVDALQRADSVARATSLGMMWDRGVINDDEWRRIEDMKPKADGGTYYRPANFVPEGAATDQQLPATVDGAVRALIDQAVRDALTRQNGHHQEVPSGTGA